MFTHTLLSGMLPKRVRVCLSDSARVFLLRYFTVQSSPPADTDIIINLHFIANLSPPVCWPAPGTPVQVGSKTNPAPSGRRVWQWHRMQHSCRVQTLQPFRERNRPAPSSARSPLLSWHTPDNAARCKKDPVFICWDCQKEFSFAIFPLPCALRCAENLGGFAERRRPQLLPPLSMCDIRICWKDLCVTANWWGAAGRQAKACRNILKEFLSKNAGELRCIFGIWLLCYTTPCYQVRFIIMCFQRTNGFKSSLNCKLNSIF